MPSHLSRRQCVLALPAAAGSLAFLPRGARAAPRLPDSAHDALPAQDPAVVREMVTVAHGNFDRVAELLKDAPRLANAAIDWGFGDWETALGAASHVGNARIARLLLDHAARPDIFTFAMLGNADAVKALLAAQPGLERTRGPHGLTLAHHARAGGEPAKPVLDFLASLPDADIQYTNLPLDEAGRARYIGKYFFGDLERDYFEVSYNQRSDRLAVVRPPGAPRMLSHLGNHTFHPAGAPEVALAFGFADPAAPATSLTITSPAPLLIAQRR
jgi:hypothetical protein